MTWGNGSPTLYFNSEIKYYCLANSRQVFCEIKSSNWIISILIKHKSSKFEPSRTIEIFQFFNSSEFMYDSLNVSCIDSFEGFPFLTIN